MKILNDFQCAKGHKEEYFVDSSVMVVTCRHCGNDATKLLAAPRSKLEGITGAFPDAYRKWDKNRQSHIAWERKTGRSDEWK
jgi:hypothetical protein